MRLSLQQKEQFFHELRELLKSGQSLPQALELKARARAGAQRKVAAAMLESARETNAEGYFAAVPDAFSWMDREIVRGGESAGRLDDAMGYLCEYYAALAKTRRRILLHTSYPVLLLHLGAFLLGIPALMQDGKLAFFASIAWFLGIFYAAFFAVWFSFNAIVRAASTNPSADQILQSIPAIGGARVALVGSRFCMLMGILVRASGSILSAMTRSASACGSALFRRGAEEAVLAVQGGAALGAAVMNTRAFPEGIDQAFQVGETSGRLDEEMQRQAARYTEQFQLRLDLLSLFLPKIIYLVIAAAIGYHVIKFWLDYYGQISALEGLLF